MDIKVEMSLEANTQVISKYIDFVFYTPFTLQAVSPMVTRIW